MAEIGKTRVGHRVGVNLYVGKKFERRALKRLSTPSQGQITAVDIRCNHFIGLVNVVVNFGKLEMLVRSRYARGPHLPPIISA